MDTKLPCKIRTMNKNDDQEVLAEKIGEENHNAVSKIRSLFIMPEPAAKNSDPAPTAVPVAVDSTEPER